MAENRNKSGYMIYVRRLLGQLDVWFYPTTLSKDELCVRLQSRYNNPTNDLFIYASVHGESIYECCSRKLFYNTLIEAQETAAEQGLQLHVFEID